MDAREPRTHRRLLLAYFAFHAALAIGLVAFTHWWVVSGFWMMRHALNWQAAPIAVAHSQGALAAYWAAFGGKLTPWRLLTLAGGSACVLLLVKANVAPGAFGELSLAYGAQPIITASFLLPCRALGVRILAGSKRPAATPERRFSVLTLLLWTAAICGVLTVVRLTPALAETMDLIMRAPEVAVGVIVTAALAAIAVWAALGRPLAAVRYGVLVVACAIAFALCGALANDRFWTDTTYLQWTATFYIGYPVLFAVWLVPLRGLGYRLTLRSFERPVTTTEPQ